MKIRISLAAVAALGVFAFAPAANAQSPGLLGFVGGSNFASFNGTDMTIGWTFTANQNLTVTSLGLYDPTPADPFGYDREVGLWDSSGTLLSSVTIPAATPLNGGFRYATSTPVTLTSGGLYFLGGLYLSPSTLSDGYITAASSATFDPAIAFGGTARSGTSSSLAFPSTTGAAVGRFGPNFQFTVNPSATPEPGSIALLVGMTTVGAGVLRRRRK